MGGLVDNDIVACRGISIVYIYIYIYVHAMIHYELSYEISDLTLN